MHYKQQFCNLLSRTIGVRAALAIVLALAAVPVLAQNAVPPTAREAAASPAFASRLAHRATGKAAIKPRAFNPSRRGHASLQDPIVYSNGAPNFTTDAWTINTGFSVSDSFDTGACGAGCQITSIDYAVWLFPGDTVSSVQIDIGTTSFGTDGGTVTALTTNFDDQGINQFGFDVGILTATISTGLSCPGGTCWLTLSNASVANGDPVYWDENSGPSQAYENSTGSIPSESFDVAGSPSGPPYPCGYGWSKPTEPSRTQAGQAQSFQVIYNFTGGKDGAGPSGLTRDQAGNFYGVTGEGGYTGGSCGDYGCGTVFKLSHQGSGWVLQPLYNFTGQDNGDGQGPSSKVLLGPDGSLYGATTYGGTGYGTVFNLKPPPYAVCRSAPCFWKESALYWFTGSDSDNRPAGSCYARQRPVLPALKLPLDSGGYFPFGDIALDSGGSVYGLAKAGNADCSCRDCGLIYQLSPSNDGWAESVYFQFDMYSGGVTSGLASNSKDGITTYIQWWQGGDDCDFGGWASDYFKLPRDGSMGAYPISVLWDGGPIFTTVYTGDDCPGGLFSGPFRLYTGDTGTLKAKDSAGNLYGINRNSIFRMSPGNDGWTYTVLYQFTGGVDGSSPTDLIVDASGNLWGTAGGGVYGYGVVWEITPLAGIPSVAVAGIREWMPAFLGLAVITRCCPMRH
jgi:hypothetical protein